MRKYLEVKRLDVKIHSARLQPWIPISLTCSFRSGNTFDRTWTPRRCAFQGVCSGLPGLLNAERRSASARSI